jgi:MscS family membrane protein
VIAFVRDFLKVFVYIVGILLILKFGFNRDIGAILTGLSIVGAALALAAKESIENLIASFIIFFDKPFFTGDTVNVRNVTGTVEHIGLRSTRIRTVDKTLVTVPNKQMVDSVVDNWSMRTNRRFEMKLEFPEQTNIQKIEALKTTLRQFFSANAAQIVSHSIFVSEFNKNGISLTVEYLTPAIPMSEFNLLKEKYNLFCKNAIEESGITLAAAGNQINIYNSDNADAGSVSKPLL